MEIKETIHCCVITDNSPEYEQIVGKNGTSKCSADSVVIVAVIFWSFHPGEVDRRP